LGREAPGFLAKIALGYKGFPGTNTSFFRTFVKYDYTKIYNIGRMWQKLVTKLNVTEHL